MHSLGVHGLAPQSSVRLPLSENERAALSGLVSSAPIEVGFASQLSARRFSLFLFAQLPAGAQVMDALIFNPSRPVSQEQLQVAWSFD